MKLERIAEVKPLPHQDHVTNYVKAYYIPEADLEQWVKIHDVRFPKFSVLFSLTLAIIHFIGVQLKSTEITN